jgi:hypothetical protein
MKHFLVLVLIVIIAFSLSLFAQTEEVIADFEMVWSSKVEQAPKAEIVWNATTGVNSLPDSINQIKNVKADIDLDQDGKKEFMVPIVHVVDGVSRRTIQVYENSGNDTYVMVWEYTFPGEAPEFVTLDESDLDGDGTLEILAVHIGPDVPSPGAELYVFENVGDNDYGTGPVVSWDLGNPARDIVRVAKAADLDNDGTQEVIVVTFTTNPSMVIASVSGFTGIPVWTIELQDDLGTINPDNAAIGIGNMDNDAFLEAVHIEGRQDTLVIVEGTGANTYNMNLVAMPDVGVATAVSVHGIDMADVNGDNKDECFMASLFGPVWVVATSGDASAITASDIHFIENTGEQLLEASTGSLGIGGSSKDFVVAASNATKAINVRYLGGPGGDVTQASNYGIQVVVDSLDVSTIVPGGMRVYGLDLAGDMDGDGLPEIVFSRGSTRGGVNAPAVFIMEGNLFPVSVNDDPQTIPVSFELKQNYPNPFNPETYIDYALPEASNVRLYIYNVLGQKVKTLVDGFQEAKLHTVRWDGSNDKGLQVPSGIYYYRLQTSEFSQSKRMLLLR